MSDEVAKPRVQVGQIDVTVTDPLHVTPVVGDIITDLRIIDGVVWLSLGSYIMDGGGPPEVRVVARLRLTPSVVAGIQQGVSNQMAALEEAKKAAN